MLFGLLVACGSPDSSSPAEAVLDEDNWLRGSFVDAFDPTVTDVELAIVEPSGGEVGYATWVNYMGDSGLAFGFQAAAIPAPDESNPFPTAPVPVLLFAPDLDIVVGDVSTLTLEWGFIDEAETAIEGSFAVSFTTVDDHGPFDIEGAFAGPVSRMSL